MMNREDAIQEIMSIAIKYQEKEEYLKNLCNNTLKEDIDEVDKDEILYHITRYNWEKEVHDSIGEVLDKIIY